MIFSSFALGGVNGDIRIVGCRCAVPRNLGPFEGTKQACRARRGERPPAPDLIFVRVELRPRPHFPFSLRLKFSFIRLRAAVHLKFLSASNMDGEKRQLRRRLFVSEITNGKDNIRKTET